MHKADRTLKNALVSKVFILTLVAMLTFSGQVMANRLMDNGGSGNSVTNLSPVRVRAPASPVNLGGVVVTGGMGGARPDGGGGSIGPRGGGSIHSPANADRTTNKSNNKKPNCYEGDPVDPSTGTKTETVTDFAEPGEMGLNFTRYYNSRVKVDNGTVDTGVWTTSIDFHLYGTQCSYGTKCGPIMFFRTDTSELLFQPVTKVDPPSNTTDRVQLTGPFNGVGTATLTYTNGVYTLQDEDARVLSFNANGSLLSIKNETGIGWTISHPNKLTTVVTHTNGQFYSITESAPATIETTRQIKVVDPAGNVYAYNTYDSVGGLLFNLTSHIGRIDSVTLPGSPGTTVAYKYRPVNEDQGNDAALIETDYNGVAHDLTTYDSDGRATLTSMADGSQKTTFSYDSNDTGNTTTVTNPLGHVKVYQYDDSGNMVSIAGNASAHCAASFASNTYDAQGNLASSKDNNGNLTYYTYATNGLLQKKVEAAGTSVQRVTDYTWDPAPGSNRLLSIKVEGLSQVDYTYDGHSRLASQKVSNLTGTGNVAPLVTTYSYALAENGMVTAVTVTRPSANNADTTTSTYNAQGFLESVTDGLNHTQTYHNYTALGQPTVVTNANGDAITYTYDARSRVTQYSHTHAGNTNTGQIFYDANTGKPSVTAAFDNEQIHNTYDADFKLTKSTYVGPAGTTLDTVYSYDANGDVINVSKTLQGSNTPAVSQSWQYDELGRVIATLGNHGQRVTTAYDGNGNPITSTDALGHATTTSYDALNRPSKVTDAAGHTTQRIYGLDDRVRQVIDNRGLSTTYAYDGFGLLWNQQSPDTGTTTYAYDGTGHRSSATPNSGAAMAYNYDPIYRITSIVAGGETHTYIYDNCPNGIGLLCAAVTPNTSTAYAYTPEGWVAQQTVNSMLGANVENYTYDGLGRVIQIENTSDKVTLNYGWTDDQVSQVSATFGGQTQTVASNITYDASRNVTGWTYGNGMGRSQTYDSDGRITGVAAGVAGNMQQNLGFSYDSADRMTGLVNTAYTAVSQNFGYDALDRLTGMSGPAPLTISYDPNGNRLQQNGPTNDMVNVDGGSNRILSRGAHSYTYDANGNRVTDNVGGSTLTYAYDGFNRLRAASRDSAASVCETNGTCPTYPAGNMTYVVDAEGRREAKTDPNGETAWYNYLPNGQPSAELSNKRGFNYYIYLGNQPIAVVHNPLVYDVNLLFYIHADQLGRPEIITDGSQNKVWQGLNFAFDRSILIENVSGIDIGLPGQIYDQETGHWNNGFRDYDSSSGRYLQSDPSGLTGGINTYAYVGNNPLMYTDPYGLWQLTIGITASPFAVGPGGVLTLGYNHGQFNLGGWLGGSAGDAFSFTPANAPCHDAGSFASTRVEGKIGNGAIGTNFTTEYGPHVSNTDFTSGVPFVKSLEVGISIDNGVISTAPVTNIVGGGQAFLGGGGQWYSGNNSSGRN